MNYFKISLGNFACICLLLMFMFLYVHERNRNDAIEARLSAITAPIQNRIARAQTSIAAQEIQLNLATSENNIRVLYESSGSDEFSLSIERRRTLARIRMAALKLKRDREQLEFLESEIERTTESK